LVTAWRVTGRFAARPVAVDGPCHQPWGQIGQGQAVDLGIQAKEFLRTKRLMEEILARHTGQPVDRVHQDTDRDYYMDPEEARTYGMIDGICTPRSKITVTPPSPNGHGP
jgi:ATP-dependent Clp protease protease subunit